jgi:hypothetical protein
MTADGHWLPLMIAGDTLETYLELVAPRASRFQLQWYEQLLAGARAALDREANPSAWHGGLLALKALIAKASVDFLTRDSDLYTGGPLVDLTPSPAPYLSCMTVACDASFRHFISSHQQSSAVISSHQPSSTVISSHQ